MITIGCTQGLQKGVCESIEVIVSKIVNVQTYPSNEECLRTSMNVHREILDKLNGMSGAYFGVKNEVYLN